MKIETIRVGGGPVRFEDFADKYDLVMEVCERSGEWIGTSGQFYAKFRGVEVMEPGVLVGAYGNGPTPTGAIEEYRRALAGKRIAINAGSLERVNVDCPTEWL